MTLSRSRDPDRARHQLAQARLMLLFSPDLCAPRPPLSVLEAVLGFVDVVQVRPKERGSSLPCSAREAYEWTARALDLVAHARSGRDVPVLVDDRVDVALALRSRGCAGAHLGQDDCPVEVAREVLGADALVGLSTHGASQVASASAMEVDYIGFGPIHSTPTKGYSRGLGAEACWVAASAFAGPVFAIGGIDATNAGELSHVGRAAVGSAILCAEDPARAARELRDLLAR